MNGSTSSHESANDEALRGEDIGEPDSPEPDRAKGLFDRGAHRIGYFADTLWMIRRKSCRTGGNLISSRQKRWRR